jgi:hypothetical protein
MERSPMQVVTALLPSVDELREHVHQTLCTHEDLDARYTPIHQTVVCRQGKPCGLFFHIQGPRLVKAYAVWSGDDNRILFYDTRGDRFAETQLCEAPDPGDLVKS